MRPSSNSQPAPGIPPLAGVPSAGAMSPDDLAAKRERLLDVLRGYGSCAVAFSGGVDSAVVAQAARLALGDSALAVTGTSDSLATGELAAAQDLARHIGIRHEVISTEEFSNPAYQRNSPDRCYHCKTELYTRLEGMTERLGVQVIVNGANWDDRGDHRPGMSAASQHAVRSPLIECQLTKDDVRRLAAAWLLPVWDKPASPCLSSRVAYGEAVTPERVAMIDQAEQFLRRQGLRELRVRYHGGDLARIEVPLHELGRLAEPTLRAALVAHLRSLGFKYITLDLEGFRSGSLNQVIPAEELRMLR
jgi:pyridinium-3,5-biscarboxylic acid mononucleotide sulfurtransferase